MLRKAPENFSTIKAIGIYIRSCHWGLKGLGLLHTEDHGNPATKYAYNNPKPTAVLLATHFKYPRFSMYILFSKPRYMV